VCILVLTISWIKCFKENNYTFQVTGYYFTKAQTEHVKLRNVFFMLVTLQQMSMSKRYGQHNKNKLESDRDLDFTKT